MGEFWPVRQTEVSVNFDTANSSKLTEKHFLDLRNLFLNQENITVFSQNKKNKLTKKNFLVPSARKFDLN